MFNTTQFLVHLVWLATPSLWHIIKNSLSRKCSILNPLQIEHVATYLYALLCETGPLALLRFHRQILGSTLLLLI